MKRWRVRVIALITIVFIVLLGKAQSMAKYQGERVHPVITLSELDVKSIPKWNKERQDIYNKIDQFLGEKPAKKPSMDARVIERKDMGSYYRVKVTYLVDFDERVRAYILIPKFAQRPGPAVLALHQTVKYGKDEVVGLAGDEDMHYGEELVKQGYIVFAPDAWGAGERIPSGYRMYDTKPFYQKYPKWSAIGKALWDNQVAVDYLMNMPIVDKKHIFVLGHSEGAVDAMFLAAFDQRISAVAMSCGLSTLSGDPNPMRWSRDKWFVAIPKLKSYLEKGEIPFDFHELVALIAPRPILSFTATKDAFAPHYEGALEISKHVEPVYHLYKEDNNLDIIIFNGKHSFPSKNRQMVYSWLKEQW